MRESVSEGDASLSGGVSRLARQQPMEVWDIGPRLWIDIDTPEALSHAEGLVRAGYFKD